MTNSHRTLLVFFKTGLLDEKTCKQEVEYLNEVLLRTESPEQICIANELVDRNRITTSKKKLLKVLRHYRLRPFCFLLNKN